MELALKETRNRIHPLKFALYVGCASILMMFVAFTSAYIVRHAAGNWLEFRIPDVFFVSTGVILLSSISLQGAYRAYLTGAVGRYRGLLVVTFILGLAFVLLQYQGWMSLQEIGIHLDGNPSGSFLYVISGMHAAHVIGGIAALGVALLHAYGLKYELKAGRKLRFELVLTYWHFVDFLWVYLLIFLLTQ